MSIEGENVSPPDGPNQVAVKVTEIDISFGNMVGLLVKLAFAAIPAAIIVTIVMYFVMAVIVKS
jgi:hypothetical protein